MKGLLKRFKALVAEEFGGEYVEYALLASLLVMMCYPMFLRITHPSRETLCRAGAEIAGYDVEDVIYIDSGPDEGKCYIAGSFPNPDKEFVNPIK